jgi:kynurenine formamidase
VVLDVPRAMAAVGRDYHPGTTVELSPVDLELARHHAKVEFETGDILVLRTGFAGWYAEQPQDARAQLPRRLTAPGLAHSESVCRYLWDAHLAAVVSDTFAVEAWPPDRSAAAAPFGFLHQMLIGSFGMALGELWWLDDVADDCAADGVHEGMLVSAPSHAPGGIGSTPNAILFK